MVRRSAEKSALINASEPLLGPLNCCGFGMESLWLGKPLQAEYSPLLKAGQRLFSCQAIIDLTADWSVRMRVTRSLTNSPNYPAAQVAHTKRCKSSSTKLTSLGAT